MGKFWGHKQSGCLPCCVAQERGAARDAEVEQLRREHEVVTGFVAALEAELKTSKASRAACTH